MDKIGDCANVVVMSMGENHSQDIFLFSSEIINVRDDVINARQILAWHSETHINNQNLPFPFKERHIAADFSEPAERDNAEIVCYLFLLV